MFLARKIVTDSGFVFLITQDSEVKSQVVLATLKSPQRSFDSLANFLRSNAQATIVPFFDYRSKFQGMKRWCRFVRREGKARFPAWLSSLDVAVMVYNMPSKNSPTEQLARQFCEWLSLPQRPRRHRLTQRARLARGSYLASA